MSLGRAVLLAARSEITAAGDASRVAQLDAFRLDDELIAIVMDHVNHVLAETPPLVRGYLSVRFSTENLNNIVPKLKQS